MVRRIVCFSVLQQCLSQTGLHACSCRVLRKQAHRKVYLSKQAAGAGSPALCSQLKRQLSVSKEVAHPSGVHGVNAGSLALWSQMKKKPVSVVRDAHPAEPDPAGPGGAGGNATSWLSAVACCRGSDLVVRLWKLWVCLRGHNLKNVLCAYNGETPWANQQLLSHGLRCLAVGRRLGWPDAPCSNLRKTIC